MLISTRRFLARAWALSPLSSGSDSPYPLVAMILESTNLEAVFRNAPAHNVFRPRREDGTCSPKYTCCSVSLSDLRLFLRIFAT